MKQLKPAIFLLLLLGVLNSTLIAEVEVVYGNKKKVFSKKNGWLISPEQSKKTVKNNSREIITLDKAEKKLEQNADLVLIDKSNNKTEKVYFNKKQVEPPVVIEAKSKPKPKIIKTQAPKRKTVKIANLDNIFPLENLSRHNNVFVNSLESQQVKYSIKELNSLSKSKIQKVYNNYLKNKKLLIATARKHGIAPEFFAIAFVESEFNNNLNNTLDSNHGIWQLNPDIINNSLDTQINSQSLKNIKSSTEIFAKYIKHLSDKYNNNWEWIVMAYAVGENYTSLLFNNYSHLGFWNNNHIDDEFKEYTAEVIAYSFLLK